MTALTSSDSCEPVTTRAKEASEEARELLVQGAALLRRADAAAQAEADGKDPAGGESTQDLRQQAETRLDEALAADLGLRDEIDALTATEPGSAPVDYSAARALLDKGRTGAAEEAALDVLKKTGKAPPEDDPISDLLTLDSGERLSRWFAANPWAYAVAAAAALLFIAWVAGQLRPRRHHLATIAAAEGGPKSAIPALDASIRAELRRLQDDHGERLTGPADAEQALPAVSTAPGWWNDAWKIWHWTQKRRTRTITVTMADLGGPTAVITIAGHDAITYDSAELRRLPDDPHATVSATQDDDSDATTFEPLVPLVAAWIAYTIVREGKRKAVFGTTDRDAWMWQARGNAALAARDSDWATTRRAARSRWEAAIAQDNDFADATLALAVLNTTEHDDEHAYRLDIASLEQGMKDLQELLDAADPREWHKRVTASANERAAFVNRRLQAQTKRRRALIARARYNLLIAYLNWVRQDANDNAETQDPPSAVDWSSKWEPEDETSERGWKTPDWAKTNEAIGHWLRGRPKKAPPVAKKIQKHVQLLQIMHGKEVAQPSGTEPRRSMDEQIAYLARHDIPRRVAYQDAHTAYSMACFWADRSIGSSSATLPQLGEGDRAEALARARESRARAERLNGRLDAFSGHDPFLKPLG